MFATLGLLVAAGLLGPLLAGGRRFRAPVVVGELAAGVALGHTGVGILHADSSPVFAAFYELGFVLLMLEAGTHVDLSSSGFRTGVSRGALALAVVAAVSVPLGFAISQVLGPGHFPLFSVLLAGSSAAVAFPIIEEEQLKGPAIPVLVAWIALADSITVVLVPLTLSHGGNLLPALGGDALIVVVGVVTYLLASRLARSVDLASTWKKSQERAWALQLRLSLLLLLVLGAIATRTGASNLVAGFVAGMVLVRLHQSDRLAIQISGVANGFFVPIFFVLLGARLDLRALVQDPRAVVLAAALAVGAGAVHLVGALAAGKQQRVATGLAASAQLGLPAAAASLGLATHTLTPALAAALVAAGCLTLIPATVGGLMLGRGSGPA